MQRKVKVAGLGEIVETIFLDVKDTSEKSEKILDMLGDICVDKKGIIRKSTGVTASLGDTDNPDFVPCERYSSKLAPWNSHQDYVEIELPNPAIDFAYYQTIRSSFLTEIGRILKGD